MPLRQILQDLSATADYARGQSAALFERVGVTGFCWGGNTTIQYAAYDKKVGAAVAWYGPPGRGYKHDPQPISGFDVAKDITCRFLGLFGAEDKNPTPEDVRKFERYCDRITPLSRSSSTLMQGTPFTPITARVTGPKPRRMAARGALAG